MDPNADTVASSAPRNRGHFSAIANGEALTKCFDFPELVSPSRFAPAALLLANSSWEVLDPHYHPCQALTADPGGLSPLLPLLHGPS